jgi:hypothetical protein
MKPEINLSSPRIFAPIWAGQPDADSELVLRMEEAFMSARRYGPIRDALLRLSACLSELTKEMAETHFLQLAVQEELVEGMPMADTLSHLYQTVSNELATVRSERVLWIASAQERSLRALPYILAANDLLSNVNSQIDLLHVKIRNSDGERHRTEEKYRNAGLTPQQMALLEIEPTIKQVEEWKSLLDDLQTKKQRLLDFTSDAPRWRTEKLQGMELPTLTSRQEKAAGSKQAA